MLTTHSETGELLQPDGRTLQPIAPDHTNVVALSTPLPVFTGAEMAAALTAYRQLQQALDAAMPEQIIRLDGKPFRRKGYWRAIAVAFNLSVDVVNERREVHGDFEDGFENFGYVVTYRAISPSGARAETGDGACFAIEKAKRDDGWRVTPRQATEHNVRAHAHTRAFNRAVSNLVGFGEVSAEEVDHHEQPVSHRPAKVAPAAETPSAGPPTSLTPSLAVLETKVTTDAKGEAYWVVLSDNREYVTRDGGVALELERLKATMAPVQLRYRQTVHKGVTYRHIEGLIGTEDSSSGTMPSSDEIVF